MASDPNDFMVQINVQIPQQSFQITATPQGIEDSRYPTGVIPVLPPPNPPAPTLVWAVSGYPNLANLAQGIPYSFNFSTLLTVTGGVTPSFALIFSAALGSGFSFNPATGAFAYTGTGVSGPITIQVQASATGAASVTTQPQVVQSFAPAAPDTFAPTVPTGLTVSATASALTWTWDAASDPLSGSAHSGLSGYLTKLNGSPNKAVSSAAGLTTNWVYTDVGAVGVTGSYAPTADGTDGSITSSGADIFGAVDAFGWINTPISGDDTLIFDPATFSATTEYAKFGLMFRQSQSVPGDICAVLVYQAVANNLQLMSRGSVGGTMVINATVGMTGMPAIKFQRIALTNSFQAFYMNATGQWVAVGTPVQVVMAPSAFAGATVCSHAAGTLATGAYTQLNNQNLPNPTFSQTSLAAGVVNSLQVAAVDVAGNISAYGPVVSGTVPPAGGGGTPPGTPVFGVQVVNGKIVSTRTGLPVQLRGAAISVLQGNFGGSQTPINAQNTGATASASTIQAYMAGADLGAYPYWGFVANTFHLNCIRIPMNEATYLRTYVGQDISNLGPTILPDNANSTVSGQYRSVIKQIVSDMNAAGIYVILDLHWTSPGAYISGGNNGQVQGPDTDHSPALMAQLAADFGSNPGVIIECFNEYYQGGSSQQQAFQLLLNGGSFPNISFNGGTQKITYSWNVTGYQALVTAFRNAGGTNMLLIGGGTAAVDLSGYSSAGGVSGGPYFPNDPLKNSGAAWHSYGVSGAGTTVTNASGSGTVNATTAANNCIAAGIPVVITECGAGDSGSANYAPVWADAAGGHALIWAYDNWPSAITGNNPPAAVSWSDAFFAWTQSKPVPSNAS